MAAGFDLFISHFYCLWWSMAYWFFFLVMGEMGWVGFVEAPGKKKGRDTHPHTHLTGTLYIGGAASAAPPPFFTSTNPFSSPPPPLLALLHVCSSSLRVLYHTCMCIYIYMYRRERKKKKKDGRERERERKGKRETTTKVL